MNKTSHVFEGLSEKRMFNIDEAALYAGMGKTRAREWLRDIGALRKFGAAARYDKRVIDAALDALESPGKTTA